MQTCVLGEGVAGVYQRWEAKLRGLRARHTVPPAEGNVAIEVNKAECV